MRLANPFYRFPYDFDIKRLQQEISVFTEADWRQHPQKFAGNSAIPLIAAHGRGNDDMFGPMLATPRLQQCPYLQQVMSHFNSVLGRSRLMCLEPGCQVSAHQDSSYYWYRRFRIHVPIVTDVNVRFYCEDASVHMGAGEAWTFDNSRSHWVENHSTVRRVHLVFDTCGSADLWALMQQCVYPQKTPLEATFIPYDSAFKAELRTEQYTARVIMDPSELDLLHADLLTQLGNCHEPIKTEILDISNSLRLQWRETWSCYGESKTGWKHFKQLIRYTAQQLSQLEISKQQPDLQFARSVLKHCLDAAHLPEFAALPVNTEHAKAKNKNAIFNNPVFIVAAPRSGSTLLFETLCQAEHIWSTRKESHQEIEGIKRLNPANRDWLSNRLLAEDADSDCVQSLQLAFAKQLRNRDDQSYLARLRNGKLDNKAPACFLEKTPKNALRIPFLKAAFPEARFIWLIREPQGNLSSIMQAWRSGRFVTYPNLPGWQHEHAWSLLLTPQWQQYINQPLQNLAALQWRSCHETIMQDLATLPREQWCSVDYQQLVANPEKQCQHLCDFIGIPFDASFAEYCAGQLPHSRFTVEAPASDKWQRDAEALASVLPDLEKLMQQIKQFI